LLGTHHLLEAKNEGVTKIISVGDSITRGAFSSDPSKSYPS
jgi:hypothetical protein